jgi:predicted ATP-dependent serine protease
MFILIGLALGGIGSAISYCNKDKIISKLPKITITTNPIVEVVKEKIKTDINNSIDPTNQTSVELIKNEMIDITKEPFLLFGKFIHRREIACIFSAPGVGKTLLAVHIARELQPKKTVIFNFDDPGVNQAARFESVPSIHCIDGKQIEQVREAMKASAAELCLSLAVLNEVLVIPSKIEGRRQKLMRVYGVGEQRKVDSILLFEVLAESKLCSDAEVIILDSLNGLVQHEWVINRDYLSRITRPFRERGQTLIILHHTNKKGEISGNSALGETMETVLQLDMLEGNYRKIIVTKNRNPQGAKDCIVQMISEGNQTVRFEEVNGFQSSDMKRGSLRLREHIIAALGNKRTIAFDEILNACECTKTGLKNSLKDLENEGLISKADGKTWKIIKNCMIDDRSLSEAN